MKNMRILGIIMLFTNLVSAMEKPKAESKSPVTAQKNTLKLSESQTNQESSPKVSARRLHEPIQFAPLPEIPRNKMLELPGVNDLLLDACESDLTEAQFQLAKILQIPYPGHALALLENASYKNHTQAQIALGTYLLKQNDTAALQSFKDNNNEKALQWFKSAALAGSIDAWYLQAKVFEIRHEEAAEINCYENAFLEQEKTLVPQDPIANPLQVAAACKVGDYYYKAGDMLKAKEWFARAYDLAPESGDINFKLAMAHVKSHPLFKTKETDNFIRELLLKAADQSHTDAQVIMGELLKDDKNYEQAHKWFAEAYKKGNGCAAYHLGQMHEQGLFIKQDFVKAVEYYFEAVKREYFEAANELKRLYLQKKKIAGLVACCLGDLCRDAKLENDACVWYVHAINADHEEGLPKLIKLSDTCVKAKLLCGQFLLKANQIHEALIQLSGAVVAKNYSALQHIEQLAKSDDQTISIQACLALGKLYADDRVFNNKQKALEWFMKAPCAEGYYRVSTYYLNGIGTSKDTAKALEWAYKAALEGHEEAINMLVDLSQKNEEAAYLLGQYYEKETQKAKAREAKLEAKAIEFYKKAGAKHVKAVCALAKLIENKTIAECSSAKIILDSYEQALELYRSAANQGSEQAKKEVERIIFTLKLLNSLSKETVLFGNYLFTKLIEVWRENGIEKMPLDLLYYTAYITGTSQIFSSDLVKQPIGVALADLGKKLSKNSRYARAIVGVFADLVAQSSFRDKPLDQRAEGIRIDQLTRICSGAHLLCDATKKEFRTKAARIKIAQERIQDILIEVFNCLFNEQEKDCPAGAYEKAVAALMSYFDTAAKKNLMTQGILYDSEWGVTGTRDTLYKLLTYHKTNRYKNRIIKISEILEGFSETDRIPKLGSWAAAGHHCKTRAERETYLFHLIAVKGAVALEEEDPGLGMRIALCLSDFRRSCLEKYVPANTSERQHQLAYIEKVAGKLLALTGDAEKFDDEFLLVVLKEYKDKKPEQLRDEILKNMTADDLINCLQKEANKMSDSRFPYKKIEEYFKNIYGEKDCYKLLEFLYDDDGKITAEGAKLLLVHFGYLDCLDA